MKYVKQFGIVSCFAFAGEILHWLIPLPVPASIYGIILLFICLELKLIKVENIKETSDFLIGIMPIMFMSPAVGLMTSWGIISSNLIGFVVIVLGSTAIVMGVSGVITNMIIKNSQKKGEVQNGR